MDNAARSNGLDIGELRARLDVIEEREESTRRRLREHIVEAERRESKIVDALNAIGSDIHALRAQKRLIIGLIAIGLPVLFAALAWATQWAVTDVLERRGVVEIVRTR